MQTKTTGHTEAVSRQRQMQTELSFSSTCQSAVKNAVQTKHRPSQGGFALSGDSRPFSLPPSTSQFPGYTVLVQVRGHRDPGGETSGLPCAGSHHSVKSFTYSANEKTRFRLLPVDSMSMSRSTRFCMSSFAVFGVTRSKAETSAAVTRGLR